MPTKEQKVTTCNLIKKLVQSKVFKTNKSVSVLITVPTELILNKS